MNILEKDEEVACKLARYEILHQCEELIIKSGGIIPIKTGNFAAKKKEHLKNIYFDGLFIEHFDRMYSEKKNHYIKIINGGPVTTLDHLTFEDVNSAVKISTIMAGLKRYKFEPSKKVSDTLEDCLGLVLKKMEGNNVTYYVFLGIYKCYKKDSSGEYQEFDQDKKPSFFKKIEEKSEKENKIYEVIADNFKFRKISDVFWQDGTKITTDDFIWSWNRAVNKLTKSPKNNLFFAIKGYDEQKEKSIEINKTYSFYKGMEGLVKENNNFFKIELNKYCPYFDSLLTNVIFFPAPRHKMTKNTGKENEELNEGWWQEKNKICGCGAFKIEEFNNVVNGKIKLVKNDKYAFREEVKIDGFTFELITDQTTAENKFNADNVDYNENFDRNVLIESDELEKNNGKLFFIKNLNVHFFLFNVNRYNSFDQFIDETYRKDNNGNELSPEIKEIIRQKMVKIVSLLINRHDLCKNVSRLKDDASNGVVSNFMLEECIPEEKDGGVVAKRDKDGKLKTALWYERSRSEEEEEKSEEIVFNVKDQKYYKIKKTYFKTNLFWKRSIEGDVEKDKKAGMSTHFNYYQDNGNHSDEKSKRVQKLNIEEAKKIAKEIGIRIDDKNNKFFDFPKINYLSFPKHTDCILRIQGYLELFGIELDFSCVDANSGIVYKNVGLYEFSGSKWIIDFYDPTSWIVIFKTGNGNNFFFTGARSA